MLILMPHPLIIDEGFGTQDATGWGKLVEAISSIQDDFQRIIVITHIDKLKDAFPVRIEGTRTNEGSTIDPPITLTITYDPALIPEGVAEEKLVIAIWKDGCLDQQALNPRWAGLVPAHRFLVLC
jgi:hypothetical protein